MHTVTRERQVTRFWLGEWQVDPAVNRLCTRHRERHIEPRQMAVLLALSRAPDRLLTKSQLIDAVWPHRFVVDGVLKRAISQLRRALGDDARAPRYIKTVYKVGYRLVAAPQHCPPVSEHWSRSACFDMVAVLDALARDAMCASAGARSGSQRTD